MSEDLTLFDVDGLKNQNQSWAEEWIGIPRITMKTKKSLL